MYKCTMCGEYTLQDIRCPKCGATVKNPEPARYSPEDKYGEYRRKAKKMIRQLRQPQTGI